MEKNKIIKIFNIKARGLYIFLFLGGVVFLNEIPKNVAGKILRLNLKNDY